MTREEAIEVLQKNYPDSCYTMLREAVDMAIEALTQDPSQDLISRQSAIKVVCNSVCEDDVPHYPDCDQIKYCDEIQALISLPSADRPTEWIPVSERLPDAEYGEGDSVLCCTETGLMYILYWDGGNWCVPTGEQHIWVNQKTGWHDRVIAWMPLPTPYKGGEDE